MKRILLFIVILAVFTGGTVMAIADPDSNPSLKNRRIFRHLIEPNDFTATMLLNIPYASPPSIFSYQAFSIDLYDSTGTTFIGAAIIFPYQDAGYGYSEVSFHFDNVTAPAWGANYIVRVSESPAHFPSPQHWDLTLAATDYSTATTQTAARDELYTKIISDAEKLNIEWTVSLLSTDGIKIVLSSTGDYYFRNAIPGLQSMCPALFSIQLMEADFSLRSWDYTLATYFESRWAGTWIGNAMTGIGGLFATSTSAANMIFFVIAFVFLVVLEMWKMRGTVNSALLDGWCLLLFAVMNGMFSFVVTGLIAFICALVTGMVLFLRRS